MDDLRLDLVNHYLFARYTHFICEFYVLHINCKIEFFSSSNNWGCYLLHSEVCVNCYNSMALGQVMWHPVLLQCTENYCKMWVKKDKLLNCKYCVSPFPHSHVQLAVRRCLTEWGTVGTGSGGGERGQGAWTASRNRMQEWESGMRSGDRVHG